jgi:hypothetical protein
MLLIGAAHRHAGKTEFACRVIGRLAPQWPIIGIKVTSVDRDDPSSGPQAAAGDDRALPLPAYSIDEERRLTGDKDTSRMLRAGAAQVLWLRVGRCRSSRRSSAKYHEISPYAMQVVADLLDIHPVEVYSVVSFYSFLDFKPKGRFIIRLCRTISCDMPARTASPGSSRTTWASFGETTAGRQVHPGVGQLHRHVRPGAGPAGQRPASTRG